MIKNEHQYRITRKLLCELESSLSSVYGDKQFAELPAKAKSAHISGLKAQLQQCSEDLSEYEALKSGRFDFNKLPNLDQIPSWLIKARIARGLNQEVLGALLRLKKQQIQQYESTDYASVSLTRIREIAEALRTHS